jgi:hypothetical protein
VVRVIETDNHHILIRAVALVKAWEGTYVGSAHELLLANINKYLNTDFKGLSSRKAYWNQVAIVQSSGTGKSRMVHELSKLVFTIPLNLRAAIKTSKGVFYVAS